MSFQTAELFPAPFSPGGTINIEGYDLPMVVYKDQPILTFKMMDQVHERPDGTARRNFYQNQDKFIEDADYFRVPYEEHKSFPAVRTSYSGPDTGQRNPKIFLTGIGYMLLVKTFKDARAWKVQRALATTYFQTRQARTTTGRAKAARAELSALKTHRAIQKQAKQEARLIHNGQGRLEDLAQYPILQDMTRLALEAYALDPAGTENGIVFRLNHLVDVCLSHLGSGTPVPLEITFSVCRDDAGRIRTVAFLARSRDILSAFDWLQEHHDIPNPYNTPTDMAAGLIKAFKHSGVPVPGWRFQSRVKSINGIHFHWFEKTVDPERPGTQHIQTDNHLFTDDLKTVNSIVKSEQEPG